MAIPGAYIYSFGSRYRLERSGQTTPQIMYLVMLQDAISMWYERLDCEPDQADELSRIDLLAQVTLNEYSRRAEASQWFHFH